MTERRIYFDYNATAPLRRGARVAMTAALNLPGNASSVHKEGRVAREVVERARQSVAALVGAEAQEVVFTSGGTEANNWVLSGGWDRIYLADVEHESVLAPAKAAAAAGARIVNIPVDGRGEVEAFEFDEFLDANPPAEGETCLLSLQWANNETGVIQPLEDIAAEARARGILIHTDAVQAAGRVNLPFDDCAADFMTLSSHKIGGPQGIGALVIRDGLELKRFMLGGGQERRWRAGTENVAAIAGFGSAAEAALRELPAIDRLAELRDALEYEILALTPDAQIIGAGGPRLANTTCVALPGSAAETLVIKLDLSGIAVSAGSACSSGKVGASHVLEAMGLPKDLSRAAIRISLGWCSTREDVDVFLESWRDIAERRRRSSAAA